MLNTKKMYVALDPACDRFSDYIKTFMHIGFNVLETLEDNIGDNTLVLLNYELEEEKQYDDVGVWET